MANIEDLINGANSNNDKLEEYFINFFDKKNYKNYEISQNKEDDEIDAIKQLFKKGELIDKVANALDYDPLCVEANFINLCLGEDELVYYRFEGYYAKRSEYGSLEESRQESYLRVMEFYVDFLIDIYNIKHALRVEHSICLLRNKVNEKSLNRYIYMYALLEDSDSAYKIYLENEFNNAYQYLLLVVNLLKNKEEIKAIQVYKEMLERIEYSDYIDHLSDLNRSDKKQNEIYECVNDSFEEISSIPDFFTWCNRVKEGL